MLRKLYLTIAGFLIVHLCAAQKGRDSLALDSTFIDYEELFSELDQLIDSLSSPRSFTLVNLSIGQSFLTYELKNATTETRKRFSYAPSVGYYDKSGFGIGIGSSIVNDGNGLNPYQYSITGSYDYQYKKKFITGISFTHFMTKGDLPFYTSPLQNDIYGYFTYRGLWFKPSAGLSYGWGSRDAFEQVEEKIQNISLAQKGFTRINTNEKVIDLNLTTSVRHDFYFLNALGSDYIRFTPQIAFVSGSQQFGFNQTSNSYAIIGRTGRNVLYNTDNVSFDDKFYFQPISLTTYVKAEYSKGKFYIQPQLIFDYYFPATSDRFTTAFLLSTGLIF